MGIGREVADAYISVHGDLSPFRRDLNDAMKDVEKAAKNSADKYGEAFGKRLKQGVHDQWSSIVDSMYSEGDKLDINRMIEKFDPTDLDNAQEKINKFLLDMARNQHLIGEDYKVVKKSINEHIDALRERNKLDAENEQQIRGLGMALDANRKFLADANAENERWARTLDGIRKNNAIKDMESDFRKLAETMNSADMKKFAKGFDNLHQARSRIYDVTAAMEQQGRMSREQSEKMQKDINDYIDKVNAEVQAEKHAADEKSRITKAALDETNRLRAAQDKYNASLNGMARNIHFSKLEGDFRNLAAAMDSNDWSHFKNGATDIDHMRRNIMDTAGEMHRLGRMTDGEFALIRDRVQRVNQTFADGKKNVELFRGAVSRTRAVFSRLNSVTRGFREHLQGFAGLNVFGDMIQQGLDFIHNLDRIAVKTGKLTLLFGTLGSVAGSSLAGIFVIAKDLGDMLGGLSALMPAFITGFGIMAYVGMTALQGMAQKYKKELKQWKEDMFNELDKGLQPAMDRFSTVMLPTLQKNLKKVAAAEGRLFGAILDGITQSTGPDKMNLMFQRMNDAMDKSHVGVKKFVDAWARLGLVGTKYFDRFATWFNKLGTDFDDFIKKAEKSGQIDKWIETGIKGFKDLGRTIDGTLGIFNGIADAARRAGSGGLSEFADKLQGAAKAIQEQGFQDTLTMLFSGMNENVKRVGGAIRDLGPAIQSVMPSIKLALVNIGDAVATIIGYVGQILTNPLVQKGITDFTGGIKKAVELLEPAIKPFANSIGNMLTLLGRIVESVAKIATAFTVELAPVLDDMSIKVQTLLDPLSTMAVNAVKALKPVADAVDKYLVGPLVNGMKGDLLPQINTFLGQAGPILAKIVKDLGPSFTTLVSSTLPGLISVATELLAPLGKVFDLFTPTLDELLKKIGKGLEGIASGLRILKGEARPEDLKFFNPFDVDKAKADIEKTKKDLADIPSMDWGDILKNIFAGDPSLGFAAVGAKIDQLLNSFADWLYPTVADGWDKLFGNGQFWKDAQSNNMDLSNGLQDLFKDQGAKGAALDKTVNDWLKTNLVDPLKKGWDDMWKGLGDWWDGVKSNFQDFMSGLLGFDTHPGKKGAVTGGGGKGSMGVSGKMDPAMFGLPSEDGVKSYFTQLGTDIREGFANALNGLGELFGVSDLSGKWNEFWTGFGTTVSDAWTNISTWISTKYTEISTGITDWLANFGTQWDEFWANPVAKIQEVWQLIVDWITTKYTEITTGITDWATNLAVQWSAFWDGVNAKVSEIWNAIVTWITTKYTEISTNISNFITTVTTNWNNFWTGVSNKVTEIWNAVVTWITTKVNEIRTNIGNFITTVTTNWNNFWTGVGNKVSQIWGQITGWIGAQIGAIVGRIGGFIGQVTGSWNSFWNGVGQTVSRAWQGLTQAVSGGVNTVMGYIRGLPGQISGALGNLWGLLTGAGEAIMGGLRQGLENMWGGLQNFVGSIAQWIKDHKGPLSYDRQLLVPAGEAIMGGLHESMKDKFGNVMSFVSQMATMMAEAFGGKSEFYLAGQNASKGIADGLLANKSVIASAYSNLGTFATGNSLGTLNIAKTGADDRSSGTGTTHSFAPGAVQVSVSTQATDPNLVANKVTDTLDDAFARFSNI